VRDWLGFGFKLKKGKGGGRLLKKVWLLLFVSIVWGDRKLNIVTVHETRAKVPKKS